MIISTKCLANVGVSIRTQDVAEFLVGGIRKQLFFAPKDTVVTMAYQRLSYLAGLGSSGEGETLSGDEAPLLLRRYMGWW